MTVARRVTTLILLVGGRQVNECGNQASPASRSPDGEAVAWPTAKG